MHTLSLLKPSHILAFSLQLVKTLLRDYDSEHRLYSEEERRLTEAHAIVAMRKMLRSPEDVEACARALRDLEVMKERGGVLCGISR